MPTSFRPKPSFKMDLAPVMSAIEDAATKAEDAERVAHNYRQMVLNDRAKEAIKAAETASSIDTLEEAIAALNALSASYAAALPASVSDRANIHTQIDAQHQQDLAFMVMVEDLTARLETLKTTDSGQTGSLASQQAQIQTMMGQIESFLATPSASATSLATLADRVTKLEGAKVEADDSLRTLPAFLLGGSSDQVFVWRTPFTKDDYKIDVSFAQTGLNLSLLSFTEKAGTRSKTGVTLTVKATGIISAGVLMSVLARREGIV